MPGRRTTTRSGRLAAAGALAALALVLAACEDGGGKGGEGARGAGGPSVIAPGRPGEAARRLPPEKAREAVRDDTPNSADLAYVRGMIEHHRQALTMTALVPDRGASARVRLLAERIAASQRPEIAAMEGWLRERGAADRSDGHEGHGGGHSGHGAMPGMASPRQLDALRAARGGDFDKLFLTLMVNHHLGAVSMATQVLSEGDNARVEEMANNVIAEQSVEIQRMRRMM
ncbi:DUF305 domain-containing protein [Streptomyces sp. B1866]|uniref:DUF305 domain-containing protein n=1 Tax=Streptomyces sp. B1866 TaxID=3075431 RepID=UPI00289013C4|nr:DUF305 domain-containing protein [Streptomyces sp. B1866]MDT3399166.1 DUF305 domain-containing protein [Streptomyces sp. B1866]